MSDLSPECAQKRTLSRGHYRTQGMREVEFVPFNLDRTGGLMAILEACQLKPFPCAVLAVGHCIDVRIMTDREQA